MRRLAPARTSDSATTPGVRPEPGRLAARWLGRSAQFATGLMAFSALLLVTPEAFAQFGPGGGMSPMGGQGGGMGGMGGPQGGPPPDKPDGPAEAAPSTGTGDVAFEPLPQWPEKKDKSLQFFQLNGYLRGRGFYWYNYNLGHYNDGSARANPFTVPYSELPDDSGARPTTGCSARNGNSGCVDKGVRTADMRFRLEPTLNLSEQIRVKAQLDIFDNLVLGSTPEGFYINGRGGAADGYPTIGTRGQQPQESAVNALQSSIRAKRAWGEVKIPLAEIAFGRMPFHWGTGMLFHDGNCLDCDFGTTVDRIMITVRQWNHFASLSWDWASTGPTSQIVTNQMLLGWHYNIDNVDDVNQWTLALGRRDDDAVITDKLNQGRAVFNYGLLAMVRTQDWDLTYNPRMAALNMGTSTGPDQPNLFNAKDIQQSLGRRSAWSLTTDLWLRLLYKKFTLEAEGVGVFGNIGELGVYADGGTGTDTQQRRATLNLQQFGGLIRGNYKFLKDSLIVGVEVGSASGAQNGDPRGELNWRRSREKPTGLLNSDGLIGLRSTRFAFDPDYHVDMILFRRILGTVYNATYMKPSLTYWLIDSFGGQAEFIYSLANKPATFPGHAINMGAEINARLMYQNKEEGFHVMLEYGVLFDLGALSQTQDIWNNNIPVDGTTAQAFQAKILLKF